MNTKQIWQWKLSRWLLLAGMLTLLFGGVFALTRSGAAQQTLNCVPGPHSGTITANEVWCLVDSPHLMSADVTVAAGVTLTIEPGVQVRAGTAATQLIVQGHLEAAGTEAQTILFTSQADSGPGEWPGITIDGGTGLLEHVIVRYAGRRIYTCPGGTNSAAISVVNVQTGTVTIAASKILSTSHSTNSDHGLCVKDSRVVVSDTLFSGIGDISSQDEFPIYIGGSTSEVSLSGLRLENNVYNEVALFPEALTARDFVLTAQPVMDGFRLLRTLSGHFVVPEGITMTVEPGVMVRVGGVNDTVGVLEIRGHLQAVGAEAAPIIFTSPADSAPYQWSGMVFEGGTGNLRHTIVRYAGRGCYGCPGYTGAAIVARGVLTGEVRIEASQVMSITGSTSMTNQGLRVENSRVTVNDTTFSGIGDNASQLDYPIYVSGATSDVSFSGLRLERNQHNRVMLDLGALTGHDFTLTTQPIMDGYEFYRGVAGTHFIVPVGIIMTVEPGVTLFNNWDINQTLVIQGHLEAVGTEAQPIVFTSHADSGPYQWKGITFEGGTGNLRHTIVRYAGRGSYGVSGGAGIAAVGVQTGTLVIEDSQVRDISGGGSTANYGLYALNSQVIVSGTRFTAISDAVGAAPAALLAAGNSRVHISGSALDGNNRNGLLVEGTAHMQVDRTALVGNGDHGILLNGNTAVLTMTNSTVLANIKDGVRNSGNARVTLGGAQDVGNAILSNGGFGANQVGTGVQLLATHNWWGDITGPYHATLNPGGQGNKVSNRVIFDPWATAWQGAPFSGEMRVWMHGPNQVSPGGTGIYALSYYNLMTQTVESAVLVLTLPTSGAYRGSTGGGIYWGARQQVYWVLGDLQPLDSGVVTVRVRYNWGIPQRTLEKAMVAFGAANLPESPIAVGDYLNRIPRALAQTRRLTAAQFDLERQALPELDSLYQRAGASGFVDVTFNRLTFNTGEVITQAVLLKPDLGAAMYLSRQADSAEAVIVDRASIAIVHATGGITMNIQTGTYNAWGDLTPALRSLQAPPPGAIGMQNCLKNCLIMDVGSAVLGEFVKAFGALSTVSNCVNFMATGNAVAAEQCITGALPGASIAAELINCFMKYLGDPNSCQCTAEKWEPAKLWGIEQCRKIPCINGVYRPDQESYYFCPFGQKCILASVTDCVFGLHEV